MTTYTIQPAQDGVPVGSYDPLKPVPYPFHIAADGSVLRQDFWKGDPASLLGFQATEEHHIDLWREEWIHDPQAAVGMFPVFVTDKGQMYSYTLAVAKVIVTDEGD
jgi:hypothetical protein